MRNKSFNKSRTTLSENSPSMEVLTSPRPILGEERVHFSHPQHPLALFNLRDLFRCTLCKEFGAGRRFKCRQCDFELHDFCALAPPSQNSHPFHSQHQLVFSTKADKGGGRCDVCTKATKGYAFRCSTCNFEMHPCCAMLYQEMDFSAHPHTLYLMSLTSGDSGIICGECKRKRSGRVYGCTVCHDYHLHAVCAKDMLNGLHANGIKAPETPSRLGAAGKLISHVVLGFIGSLVEGIGEGIGEFFIDSIVRTHSRRRSG
ncbi:hypothetical protein HHK36_008859 [Tetracentron sinense]|uniref:Phorbol-ester/DAG-type domain-containing protein n=1 Tax=Tetracentron sinense TaxID=13715 RepID=A0A834ZHJ9_TETSI|nr:hypothetical protein HHK36_008859 [Tetracentron sinense]